MEFKYSRHFTLKRDGSIALHDAIVGRWWKKDIWAENHAVHGRDRSGNKLVHYMWCFSLNTGMHNEWGYTRKDMYETLCRMTDKVPYKELVQGPSAEIPPHPQNGNV